MPVPGQRIDRAEAWEQGVEEEADRKEVIRDTSGIPNGISTCTVAREKEQDSTDKAEFEAEMKLRSDFGVGVPL